MEPTKYFPIGCLCQHVTARETRLLLVIVAYTRDAALSFFLAHFKMHAFILFPGGGLSSFQGGGRGRGECSQEISAINGKVILPQTQEWWSQVLCGWTKERAERTKQKQQTQAWPLQPQIQGDFNASSSELSEHPLFENVVKLVAVALAACIRNQRPSLLQWEADVSEEFLLTAAVLCFMVELQMPPRLPLRLFLYVLDGEPSSLLWARFWHITVPKALCKSAGGPLLPQSASSSKGTFFHHV